MAISGNQLKAARALVGWDQQALSEQARVGINTVRNMEAAGVESIRSRTDTLDAVIRALEAAGVEFTNGGQPGVRMKAAEPPESDEPDFMKGGYQTRVPAGPRSGR